jgi:hypothetical protein
VLQIGAFHLWIIVKNIAEDGNASCRMRESLDSRSNWVADNLYGDRLMKVARVADSQVLKGIEKMHGSLTSHIILP